MSTSQYPNDDQFAGLLQVATAAADAQLRHSSSLKKRKREDESLIDTQLRSIPAEISDIGPDASPMLQSSAAVLFREPSEKSKKYSRPPLGKVFAELEMAPESFLRLQSAAKAFMLDDNYVERRNVVGQKKQNSHNDVAKLKLWNCVEQFLDLDGNGDRYFGPAAGVGIPDSPPRSFYWPHDRNTVIKKCMPLFRKMVTNERQRLYASETRKQDPVKVDKSRKLVHGDGTQHFPPASLEDLAGDFHPERHGNGTDQLRQDAEMAPSHLARSSALTLHINVVSRMTGSSRRLTPRITIPSDSAHSLQTLFVEIQKRYDLTQHRDADHPDELTMPTVKVWLDGGLAPIGDDVAWMHAQLNVGNVEWMDGELRVLIEV